MKRERDQERISLKEGYESRNKFDSTASEDQRDWGAIRERSITVNGLVIRSTLTNE